MLSLKRCRAILGPDYTLDDDELRALRDSMYSFGGLLVFFYPKYQRQQKDSQWEGVDKGQFSKGELEDLDERAAIMEYDGGISRKDAEKAAIIRFEELRRKHEEGDNLL